MHSTAYCKNLRASVTNRVRLYSKTWLIMKLTVFLLLVSTLHVNAGGYAQVTLDMKNAPLIKVLNEVRKQSGYYLVYTKGEIAKASAVNINISNVSLEKALMDIFKGQPLAYSIQDKFIIIRSKPQTPPEPSPKLIDTLRPAVTGNKIKVQGRIIADEGAEPLAGAAISVHRPGNAVFLVETTDANGNFKLMNLANGKVCEGHPGIG